MGTGGKPVEYQTAVWESTSRGRSASPYQREITSDAHCVRRSCTWSVRWGRRSPTSRGRPFWWGHRGGAGAKRRASSRSRVTIVATERTASIALAFEIMRGVASAHGNRASPNPRESLKMHLLLCPCERQANEECRSLAVDSCAFCPNAPLHCLRKDGAEIEA